MADIKWIKVAVDMFEDNKIEFIRSLPEGDAIIVTWIQMLSIAGQSNMGGYLMVTEGIPYTEQLLSNKLRRQPVLLQFALETLSKLKMIDIEDGPFHITKWEKHQNVEGMEKVRLLTNERVKKHRSKEKEKIETLPSNATVTLQVTHSNATELELELDLELDKEKDKKSSSSKHSPQNIFGVYQREIGELSEIIAEKLIDLELTYSEEWVKQAIKVAVMQNIKKLSYIEGTLKRWKMLNHDEPWTLEKEQQSKNNVRPFNKGFSGKQHISIIADSPKSAPLTDEEREKLERMAELLDGDKVSNH